MQLDNKQEQDIEKWMKQTRNRNGYVIRNTLASEVENHPLEGYRPDEHDSHKREWQFRIAVYPTRDNLNRAVEALASVFKNSKFAEIEFKCLVLNDPDTMDENSFRVQ